MSTPVVFVETNFLVALLFPHLDSKLSHTAKQLRDGNGTDYIIEIPFYATFESLSTTRSKKAEMQAFLGQMRMYSRNLRKSQRITDDQIEILDQIDGYSNFNFEAQLIEILDELEVIHIDHRVMEIARHVVSPLQVFSRGDAMDAYIFASILKRCEDIDPNVPKIFMSTNVTEFRKVPAGFLEQYQLVYINNFNFINGMNEWNDRYALLPS